MKIRLKPAAVSTEEYLMIGISTSLKDYQLAYYINKQFGTYFVKKEDITFYNKKGTVGLFPFYFHNNNDLRIDYYLFGNRSKEGFVLPKYKNFEFIILFNLSSYTISLKEILQEMRHIKGLNAALEIPLITVKNLADILEDIELHLLEISTRKNNKDSKAWLW